MRRIKIPDINKFIARYIRGESINKLAREIGISRKAFSRNLQERGIRIRNRDEANILTANQRTKEQNQAYTHKAHLAVLGKKRSYEELLKRAKTRELLALQGNGLNISPMEMKIVSELVKFNISIVQQAAIGKYNVDLLVEDILAIEVYGGAWHRSKNHKKRDEFILEQGFYRLNIWGDSKYRTSSPYTCSQYITQVVNKLKKSKGQPREVPPIWFDGVVKS